MGLDITAYSRIQLLPEGDYGELNAPGGFDYVEALDVPGTWSLGSLIAGRTYRCDAYSAFSFRAGAYGCCNVFRERLAGLAGYTPEQAWNEPNLFEAFPFFYIVNFSDAEGTIGPDIATLLANDFHAYAGKVLEHPDWNREPFSYLKTYKEFHAAFALASGTGLVQFH